MFVYHYAKATNNNAARCDAVERVVEAGVIQGECHHLDERIYLTQPILTWNLLVLGVAEKDIVVTFQRGASPDMCGSKASKTNK
jgi:hypothetical protein